MKRRLLLLLLLYFSISLSLQAQNEPRFPKPEFDSEYEQPTVEHPEPRALRLEYLDVLILLAVMSLTAFFALKRRSRKAIMWLSIFSLLYFGFYRVGCICSVGSVQNVAMSLFGSGYAVSLTVLAFFVLPLIFALFFGRVFCAAACPLGVIQDLVHIKSVKVPLGLQKALSLFPYIYLAFAVLFAATGSDFIICRYDPFVGIFRMDAAFHLIVLGIAFLLIGMFVGRPYCRFACPYSVPLKWMSHFSKYHLSITPDKCINCRLCEDSCPFDAIDMPTESPGKSQNKSYLQRFALYLILIPLLAAASGFLLSESSDLFAKVNSKVRLAEIMQKDEESLNEEQLLEKETFLASGKTADELLAETEQIRSRFYTGAWIVGIFIGAVLAIVLLQTVVFRTRTDYTPNKANCFSCGRCFDHCPVEKSEPQKPWIKKLKLN